MTEDERNARWMEWERRLDEIGERREALQAEEDAIIDEINQTTAEALGIPSEELTFSFAWGCPKSPTNTCAYDAMEDPCMDECLFCGRPDERK